MRRWLRVLVVGVLTVVLSIDSASACRLFRGRCRPRCRVLSCRVVRPVCGSVVACRPHEPAVVVESLPVQCCVPADGSARAVIVEMDEAAITVPSHAEPASIPSTSAPVAAEATRPATPTPVLEPLEPLTPIAPASAEQSPSPKPPAGAEPAPATQPQFKTAAEILTESAEKERLEKAAAEAATPPAPEPQFKTAAEILAESAEKETADKPVPQPAPEGPQDRPTGPPMEKAPSPQPIEENLFDEGNDDPAREDRVPMKKKAPPKEAIEDLFDEPEAETSPSSEQPESTEKPADEGPSEEPTEKTEDDPFAALDADPEPVRLWIDSSGRHQTIGRLVEVHSERVRILKANGRYTTVPMQQLSQHDQAYVASVGERLAGRAPAHPAATDTALR